MKHLLLPLMMLISLLANAQIKKGTVLLGGSIYATTYEAEGSYPTDSRKQSAIAVAPSFGIATKENVVWGVNAYFSTDKNKSHQQSRYTTYTYYGAGIFTRRYMSIAKAFYLFGEAGVGYSHNKQENPYYSSQTSETSTDLGVNFYAYPGIAYAISRSMQLELGLPNMFHAGYNQTKDVYTYNGIQSESTNKGVNVSMNLNPSSQLAVGFRILLGN